RIVRELVEARVDRVAAGNDREGVAVGRGFHADLRAERAAGAGAVLHDDLLLQRLGQLLRGDARDEVGAAARRERRDEADRLRRVGRLRHRWRCKRGGAKEEGGSRKAEVGFHKVPITYHLSLITVRRPWCRTPTPP